MKPTNALISAMIFMGGLDSFTGEAAYYNPKGCLDVPQGWQRKQGVSSKLELRYVNCCRNNVILRGGYSGIENTENISDAFVLEQFNNSQRNASSNHSVFPRSSPGPLSVGERALLHAMRKLTIEAREKTLGKVADEDPILAEKLKSAGSAMNDVDWNRFDSELQERMASKFANIAAQVCITPETYYGVHA
jgi:hypothetical protein